MGAIVPSQQSLARARILVVGDAMLDRYWFGDVERISPEAPVPIVRVRRTEERLGGAANVARNVTALGARAGVLAVIGTDEAGSQLTALISGAGIAPHVHRDSKIATTVKLRVVGLRQQMMRIDFEQQPDEEVLLGHLNEFSALLPDYDLVVLSDYGKGGLSHIEQIIKRARQASKPVLVDPKGDDYARYAGATIITPNRAELQEVVGRWKSEGDLEARAQKLRGALGLDALLLTRSEEGMTLFTADGAWSVPAQAREVFDVSGAGDTVIAVLAVMLAARASMRDAVMLANRAGGVAVSKLGTSTVTYEELLAEPI